MSIPLIHTTPDGSPDVAPALDEITTDETPKPVAPAVRSDATDRVTFDGDTPGPNTVDSISPDTLSAGEPADFDALFRANQPRLVDALTLVAGDRDTAADAVQEAFVRAHLRWKRVGSYEDPIGWVRRVAINRLRDEHRRRGRRRSALARLSARPTATVEHPLPDHELMTQLAELPRRQRLCVVLRYVEDLSTAEIARTLDVSEGTVKSNLSDARARLRTQLGRPPGGTS
ncbi:MAG: SigE family RNA polymerase sigma factor [Actinomycetota bacterium]